MYITTFKTVSNVKFSKAKKVVKVLKKTHQFTTKLQKIYRDKPRAPIFTVAFPLPSLKKRHRVFNKSAQPYSTWALAISSITN